MNGCTVIFLFPGLKSWPHMLKSFFILVRGRIRSVMILRFLMRSIWSIQKLSGISVLHIRFRLSTPPVQQHMEMDHSDLAISMMLLKD